MIKSEAIQHGANRMRKAIDWFVDFFDTPIEEEELITVLSRFKSEIDTVRRLSNIKEPTEAQIRQRDSAILRVAEIYRASTQAERAIADAYARKKGFSIEVD